jgi:hypothetical protein
VSDEHPLGNEPPMMVAALSPEMSSYVSDEQPCRKPPAIDSMKDNPRVVIVEQACDDERHRGSSMHVVVGARRHSTCRAMQAPTMGV